MPDIYNEALADKKRLLEVAEENAIRRITAATTPKIKALIERQLASDVSDDADGDRDVLLDLADDGSEDAGMGPPGSTPSGGPGLPSQDTIVNAPPSDPVAVTAVATAAPTPDVASGEPAGLSLPGEDGKVTLDLDSLQGQDANAAMGIPPPGEEDDAYELTGESVQALKALLGQVGISSDRIELRCIRMREAIDKIVSAKKSGVDTVKNQETARQIKVECEHLYRQIRDSGQSLSESVSTRLQDKLEGVYSIVMEHYSVAGHLAKIVEQVKAINKNAGKLNKLNESTGDGVRKHIISCFSMMRDLKSLHGSIRGLTESLGADDSVDSASVRQAAVAMGKLYKEIRQMAGKNGKLVNEHEVMLRLSLPDELEVDPQDIDVSVVEAEPEDGVPGEEGPSGMDDLDLDAGAEGGEEEDLEGYMPEEDYLLQIDLPGDAEVAPDDVGVSVADDEMAGDEAGEEEELDMGESVLRDDDVVEIDEAALVQEMKRMKALREEKYKIQHGGHGPDHFDAFGGGKEEGESFVDGEDLNQSDETGSEGYLEESDLAELDELDELEETDEADELDEVDEVDEVEESKKPGKKNAKAVKEGKQLAESKDVRAKLAEAKLLNTKLVALNRLLQVPGLKKKDKEQIVETLDKGKNSAEVEQLYKKIVEALKKRSAKINESADGTQVLGSSSRASTTSSSTAESQADPLLERWAKIAGTDVLKD